MKWALFDILNKRSLLSTKWYIIVEELPALEIPALLQGKIDTAGFFGKYFFF